jgi:hypothetical protein
MTDFERFVEYVAGYDAAFPKAIRGATPEQLAELDELLGGRAPAAYRDFLTAMGQSMDWITVRAIDFHIEGVLAWYRANRWLSPSEFVRIGTEQDEPRVHPYLEVHVNPGELPVVGLPPCSAASIRVVAAESLSPVAGSLVEMAAYPVFRAYELKKAARQPAGLRARHWSAQAMPAAAGILAAMNFQRLWWSTETGSGWQRADAAVWVRQHLGHGLQVLVAADADSERNRVAAQLQGSLNLARGA